MPRPSWVQRGQPAPLTINRGGPAGRGCVQTLLSRDTNSISDPSLDMSRSSQPFAAGISDTSPPASGTCNVGVLAGRVSWKYNDFPSVNGPGRPTSTFG